jgi:polysaccharide deacetylase 2 family uncharacterized protein YibQ
VGASLPFAKSDVTIDIVPSAAEIDRALGRRAALARDPWQRDRHGKRTADYDRRIAPWTKAAAARGVQLVPITAILAKTRSS